MRFIYRTTEVDDDGDSLDFGTVQARTTQAALGWLSAHFTTLGIELPTPVFLYPVTRCGPGVWETAERTRHIVRPREDR